VIFLGCVCSRTSAASPQLFMLYFPKTECIFSQYDRAFSQLESSIKLDKNGSKSALKTGIRYAFCVRSTILFSVFKRFLGDGRDVARYCIAQSELLMLDTGNMLGVSIVM
jgi:hypothetical protein